MIHMKFQALFPLQSRYISQKLLSAVDKIGTLSLKLFIFSFNPNSKIESLTAPIKN